MTLIGLSVLTFTHVLRHVSVVDIALGKKVLHCELSPLPVEKMTLCQGEKNTNTTIH